MTNRLVLRQSDRKVWILNEAIKHKTSISFINSWFEENKEIIQFGFKDTWLSFDKSFMIFLCIKLYIPIIQIVFIFTNEDTGTESQILLC